MAVEHMFMGKLHPTGSWRSPAGATQASVSLLATIRPYVPSLLVLPSEQHLLTALRARVPYAPNYSSTGIAQVVPCRRVPLVDGQCLACHTHETALNAPSHTPQHTLAHHTSDPESHRLRHAPPPVTLEAKYRQAECHHVPATPWHAPESAGSYTAWTGHYEGVNGHTGCSV